ncbi:MAG: S41 family peptidase [Sphingomonas sp.]|nr:S41 family peptidase [Sphingomonas sp.]
MFIGGCLVAGAPATTSGTAPASSAERRQLDARAVVGEVRRIISKRYVVAERRPALDAVLAQGLASGRYNVDDPEVLIERVNADLKRVGRDRHLYLDFDPARAAQLAAEGEDSVPDPTAVAANARARNHGIVELRLLPGNIRYLGYEGDLGIWVEEETPAALESAMRFLSGADAIIIDIRAHRGGTPKPAQYMLSHFLPAKKQLYTSYEGNEANPTYTLPTVAAGRMIGKPLYVLTSSNTASAAEEFAGSVAGFGIGHVVGATTAGAGYMNEVLPIDGRFVLSFSTARVLLASTGRSWEAVGIIPTVRTDAPQALEVAHVHALRRLAAKATGKERTQLQALTEGFAARVEPRTAALPMSAYAGRYGERVIVAEGGRLYYQRGTRPRTTLVPLGGNRFAFDNNPAEHLDFVAKGSSVGAFALRRPDGSIQGTYERTP